MRPLLVVFGLQGMEPLLLLEEVGRGGDRGGFLEGQTNSFMPSSLFGVAQLDRLDTDPEPEPPHRQLAQSKEAVGGGKGHAVVAAQASRQARLLDRRTRSKTGKGFYPLILPRGSAANR